MATYSIITNTGITNNNSDWSFDLAVIGGGPGDIKGAIITDENLRTSTHSIYAIGDVNSKYILAHKAIHFYR